jgi:hypothetical protein
MNLQSFAKIADLAKQTELEKVRRLSYYFHKTDGKRDFSVPDVATWFGALHFHTPNTSRLVSRIAASKSFIRGEGKGEWRLHAVDLDELQMLFPGVSSLSEEIFSEDTVLPTSVYEETRGFIESLARQINASYEYNIFDGCAVLMRRLVEILLILSYEHHSIDNLIKLPDGSYKSLDQVISDAKQNGSLKLTKDTKATLETFRSLGNFSAHKIYYNCRRSDLKHSLPGFRTTIEELLYKSGLKS